MSIAAELVRERAHVAGTLHVVLAPQRADAHALAAEIASGHREVRDAHHHGRALAVLRHAEPVVDRAVRPARIQARRGPQRRGRYARNRRRCLRRIARLSDKGFPAPVCLDFAARLGVGVVREPLGDDHVRERVDYRHVRPGP